MKPKSYAQNVKPVLHPQAVTLIRHLAANVIQEHREKITPGLRDPKKPMIDEKIVEDFIAKIAIRTDVFDVMQRLAKRVKVPNDIPEAFQDVEVGFGDIKNHQDTNLKSIVFAAFKVISSAVLAIEIGMDGVDSKKQR